MFKTKRKRNSLLCKRVVFSVQVCNPVVSSLYLFLLCGFKLFAVKGFVFFGGGVERAVGCFCAVAVGFNYEPYKVFRTAAALDQGVVFVLLRAYPVAGELAAAAAAKEIAVFFCVSCMVGILVCICRGVGGVGLLFALAKICAFKVQVAAKQRGCQSVVKRIVRCKRCRTDLGRGIGQRILALFFCDLPRKNRLNIANGRQPLCINTVKLQVAFEYRYIAVAPGYKAEFFRAPCFERFKGFGKGDTGFKVAVGDVGEPSYSFVHLRIVLRSDECLEGVGRFKVFTQFYRTYLDDFAP